jgi:hypothetical protein
MAKKQVAVAFWNATISGYEKKATASEQRFHAEYDCEMNSHEFVSNGT